MNIRSAVEGDPTAGNRLAWVEHVLILASTAIIVAALLQAAPLQSANDRSRWATVWSLVERRTFQIDEIDSVGRWSTIDKVRYRTSESEPWHFYSSKPPLLSTMVAGLYAVERATLGFGLFNDTAYVTRLLLMFVNVLPFYLSLISLSRCLRIFGSSLNVRMFVLAVAGFASILNPYLTTLNNHTPAVACAMFSITAAARILESRFANGSGRNGNSQNNIQHVLRRLDFASLGFFSALTCCFELPAAQWGVLAFLIVAFINRRWTVTYFLPAAAIPLIAFFATNWLATGGVKPFYATYGTETYVYEHNGIPSYWSHPRDLDANTESTPVYLFHCILGHHGLLSLTPVLCLSISGWWFSAVKKAQASRRVLILLGAMTSAITLGFYLTRTQNYNYGGNSVGLRWMLWLSPFWWIALVPALERCTRRGLQGFASLSLLISIISVSWSMNRPWRPSWLYEQMEAAGFINYKTPIPPFPSERLSVFATWPDEAGTSAVWRNAAGEKLVVTAYAPGQAGGLSYTRGVGPAPKDNPKELLRRFELESSGKKEELDLFSVGRNRLVQIVGIEFVLAREYLRAADQSYKAGKPVPSRPVWTGFRPAGVMWIPSKADRTKARKVERGAARVLIDDSEFGKCWHRCDVLYCDELPFGVLQWKTTISSEATGEVLSTETWIAENY